MPSLRSALHCLTNPAVSGLAAILAVTGALLPACTSPPPSSIRQEIILGDRQREWGLVYYQSWQKERNRHYLMLARQRTQEAILLYLDAQRRMGYAYPTFYVVDRRRMDGCLFLRQMQVEAAGSAVTLDDTRRVGCFDR